jgi:hypothetical protein
MVALLGGRLSRGQTVTSEERCSIERQRRDASRRIATFDAFVRVGTSRRRRWGSVLLGDEGIRRLERRIDEALVSGDAKAAHRAIGNWEAACRRRLDQPRRRTS